MCVQASIIAAFERLRGEPSAASRKGSTAPATPHGGAVHGLGMTFVNRSSVWGSRRLHLASVAAAAVAGNRLASASTRTATHTATHTAAPTATASAASSVRFDDRLDGLPGEAPTADEIRRIRAGLDELARRLDAVLERAGRD